MPELKKPTWSDAVERAIIQLGYFATLKQIYEIAPLFKKFEGLTPHKTINERVQRDKRFYKILPGLYALANHLDKIPLEYQPMDFLDKKILKNPIQISFWYIDVGEIAKFSKEDREVIISSCGLIIVKFPNEDFYRKNGQAVDVALSRNLFDKDLKKLEFDDCNWFDFLYRNSKMENWEDVEGDEQFSYSSALKAAKEYINDDEFWEQFLRRTTQVM
jgi:hypothetical protein